MACTTTSFSRSLTSNSEGCVNYVSLNNRRCKDKPIPVNINSNESLYYPFTVSVETSVSGRGCKTIDDLYARNCAPGKVKNMNVKVFNSLF